MSGQATAVEIVIGHAYRAIRLGDLRHARLMLAEAEGITALDRLPTSGLSRVACDIRAGMVNQLRKALAVAALGKNTDRGQAALEKRTGSAAVEVGRS